jgi:hypothetical protein
MYEPAPEREKALWKERPGQRVQAEEIACAEAQRQGNVQKETQSGRAPDEICQAL